MTVTAEFVGGPRDGETIQLHAATWQLRVSQQASRLFYDGDVELRNVSEQHVYKLRPGTQLGQSSGHVFYDYDGRER